MMRNTCWFKLISSFAVAGIGLGTMPGCFSDTAAEEPGALIQTTMTSQVGVVLDEIPAALRDKVAAGLMAKDDAFWIERAKKQLAMTKFRLNFRSSFYTNRTVMQLPLPPVEKWVVTLKDGPGKARRTTIGTHDVVVVDYSFSSTLLSDTASVAVSQPELGSIGGIWDEPFVLPVDPELLFQRTGYACMDEVGFPPNSVDSEETAVFYDHSCTPNDVPSQTACHFTQLPKQSCVEALDASVGKVETKLHFERLAWDTTVATAARVGEVTNSTGPDIRAGVHSELFPKPKLIYRYIPEGDCTLEEKCVGGSGWRRLLEFSSVNWNTGNQTLNIGAIDYLVTGSDDSELAKHHIYEYSACHKHYHFMHYGMFTFGAQTLANSKRGFCLQSTDRLSNNEHSPLNNAYQDCSYQGIEAGWGDNYNAGIECQWIDVTEFDVSQGPLTDKLHETFNPDGFLCEGTPELDAQGNQIYEPTDFTTAKGESVDRPSCNFMVKWDSNNQREEEFTLPATGESFVTLPCTRGQIGPLRNCGFAKQADLMACKPGTAVKLHCAVPTGSAPQTARFCESSKVLQSGTACAHAFALGNEIITEAGVDVTLSCPAARSMQEPGGLYALYTSPLVDDDAAAVVTCDVVP